MKTKLMFLLTWLVLVALAACAPAPTPVPSAAPTPTPAPTAAPPTATARATETLRAATATPGPAGMVFVPAGDFAMGSNDDYYNEKPLHTVYLDAFWIDKYEVTNAQFLLFADAKGYITDAEKQGVADVYDGTWVWVHGANWEAPRGPGSNIRGKQNYPVTQVSWNDANAFCMWVGKRLPTEAEWEKAARGTDAREFPSGNSSDVKSRNTALQKGGTTAVGSYPAGASPYGALDMAGNVYEWVADWYDSNYYADSPRNNPKGPSSGQFRVMRGGSWRELFLAAHAAHRFVTRPDSRFDYVGFRCAQ